CGCGGYACGCGCGWVVRWRGRALVLIRVWVVSLWIWICVSGVRALGRLWGRAGAGGGTAAEYVFVGGVALGAGSFGRRSAQGPSKARRDEED
ncbi:hypothetical protein B0H13DRAFT_2050832, partial [Mycena leptocephala]